MDHVYGGEINMKILHKKYMNTYLIQGYMNLVCCQIRNINFLEQVQMVLLI